MKGWAARGLAVLTVTACSPSSGLDAGSGKRITGPSLLVLGVASDGGFAALTDLAQINLVDNGLGTLSTAGLRAQVANLKPPIRLTLALLDPVGFSQLAASQVLSPVWRLSGDRCLADDLTVTWAVADGGVLTPAVWLQALAADEAGREASIRVRVGLPLSWPDGGPWLDGGLHWDASGPPDGA